MSDDGVDGTVYRFVPGVRRGFRPADEFRTGGTDATGQPTTGIRVTARAQRRNGGNWDEKEGTVNLDVYGPGDVIGFDRDQVSRVEPEPGTAEFPPNYFPFVEFDRPDLPWMFSPERADGSGRARPWFTLVTVEAGAAELSAPGDRPLPYLRFDAGATLSEQLPPPAETWAWAHAQVTGAPPKDDGGGGGTPTPKPQDEWMEWAPEVLRKDRSNLTVSRLISPRNLSARTEYVACVVPTFEPGRRAGLGKPPFADPADAEKPVEFAWQLSGNGATRPPFELPVYHHWRFTAGKSGTFEQLVSELSPETLGESVGLREVDATTIGPDSLKADGDSPGARTVEVAGAMYSQNARNAVTEPDPDGPGRVPAEYSNADHLRELLNKPETLLTTTDEDGPDLPVVGPHLYGQWHAGMEGIPEAGDGDYDPAWFRQLNVNPRNRIAAAAGAEVVREKQGKLMSAAWEVVGEIRKANRYVKWHQVASAGEDDGSADAGAASDRRRERYEPPERAETEGVREDPVRNYRNVRRERDRLEKLGALEMLRELGLVGPTDPGEIVDGSGGWIEDVGLDLPTPSERVERVAGGDVGGPSGGIEGVSGGERPEAPRGDADGVSGDVPITNLVDGAGMGYGRAAMPDGLDNYLFSGSGGMSSRGDGLLERGARAPVRDGGAPAATDPGAGGPALDAAMYVAFLDRVVDRPESSLAFRRLTRPEGRIANVSSLPPDFDATFSRAVDETLAELGTVGAGTLRRIGREPAVDPAAGTATGPGGPSTGSGPGEGDPPTGEGDGDAGRDGGGESDGAAAGDLGPGTAPAGALQGPGPDLDLTEISLPRPFDAAGRLPRIHDLEVAEESRSNLDARMADAPSAEADTRSGEGEDERTGASPGADPGADLDPEAVFGAADEADGAGGRDRGLRTVYGLLDGIDASADRVGDALGTGSDGSGRGGGSDGSGRGGGSDGPGAGRGPDAGEAPAPTPDLVDPVVHSLDPLERALRTAVADEAVDLPEAATREALLTAVGELRAATRDLRGALAAGADPGGAEPGGPGGQDDGSGGPGGSEGAGGRGDGAGGRDDGGAGDGENGSGAAGSPAPADGLAAVREAVDRIRSLLAADDAAGRSPVPSSLLRKRRARDRLATPIDPRSDAGVEVDTEPLSAELGRRDGNARYFRTRLDRLVTAGGRSGGSSTGGSSPGGPTPPSAKPDGGSNRFARSTDPVDEVMLAPEFPTPMSEPLIEKLSQDYLLPGAEDVPEDSVGLVVENREFIESYMAGLNHEMARELLWRGYPTDRRGTYFRRFWNKGRGPAWDLGEGVDTDRQRPYDVAQLHEWDTSNLRDNAPGGGPPATEAGERVFLLIRGRLFERFPNAVVYAAKARKSSDDEAASVVPDTPEGYVEANKKENVEDPNIAFPSFRGELDPDVTFLGFDLRLPEVKATKAEVEATNDGNEDTGDLGWYFVFEERPGETRFGLDIGSPEDATRRPIGVAGDGETDATPDWARKLYDSDPGATALADLVGWDGLSWHHVAGPGNDPADVPYVSVTDSQLWGGGADSSWRVTERQLSDLDDVQKGEDVPEIATEDVEDLVTSRFDDHDRATWGKNGAHMARITWQKPVRVSMHANQLLFEDPSDPGFDGN